MFRRMGPGRFPLFSLAVASLRLQCKGAAPRADKPASGVISTPAIPAIPPRVEETPPHRRLSGLSALPPWAAYLGIIAAAVLSMADNRWVALALYAYLLVFLIAHALLFRTAEKPLSSCL